VCGEPQTISAGEVNSATFTLVGQNGGTCEYTDNKTVGLESIGDDEFAFLPLGSGQPSQFVAVLHFEKPLSNFPVLEYDQILDTNEVFEDVPECDDLEFDEGGNFESATVPDGHSWCITGLEVTSSSGTLIIDWSVYGVGDPRFR
jgi:hypothetical protein